MSTGDCKVGGELVSLLDALDKTIDELDLASPSMPGDWRSTCEMDSDNRSWISELFAEVDNLPVQRSGDNFSADPRPTADFDSLDGPPSQEETPSAADTVAALVALGYNFTEGLYYTLVENAAKDNEPDSKERSINTAIARQGVLVLTGYVLNEHQADEGDGV
ncbi:hypothetical protein EXIGLDRAFT_692278 [Exidia glandulosa HHB12029]|uniref:Uncharacterized protein n=1 Tax=Exidia glandulosa HHB12029 TaxID=1314781 RepID=A0A165P0M5_EXIGL|nr:hypothetical protein EXIGLDRAFT_692278 [Exidia glandulosa HHB12029]